MAGGSTLTNVLGTFTRLSVACQVTVGAVSQKTPYASSSDPVWESSFVFNPLGADNSLDVSCVKSGLVGDDPIGSVSLLLPQVYRRISESTTPVSAVEVAIVADDGVTVDGNLELSFRCPGLTQVASAASPPTLNNTMRKSMVGETDASTYSEAELQPVGTPGREHKLQVASRLIEEIGTKAASMGG